jgi:hypothetical protein
MFELSLFQRPFRDDKTCFDYLRLTLFWFHIRWFLDAGEWFFYVEWWTKHKIYGYRFSSAGNMSATHIRSNCRYSDEDSI